MIKKILNKVAAKKYKSKVERLNAAEDDEQYDSGIKKVMNLLSYTRRSETSYSGYNFNTGYHSLEIGKYSFDGQRNPKMRFKDLPFSLEGLSVLDIGCNQGGMLHAFADQIKFGVGVDYDQRMINVASKISAYNQTSNLSFYSFNLEEENLDYLQDFLPENKVDVVLVLSICIWVKNWKEVLVKAKSLAEKLVFESNGKDIQQEEQIDYLKSLFTKVELIHERSEDDATQKFRKLLVCS